MSSLPPHHCCSRVWSLLAAQSCFSWIFMLTFPLSLRVLFKILILCLIPVFRNTQKAYVPLGAEPHVAWRSNGWCWRRPSTRLNGVSSLGRQLFDGFWYCGDLEREPVPHPRLDLLFLKIALSALQNIVLDLSSRPPVSVLAVFSSPSLSPLFSLLFPSLSLLKSPCWCDGR